MCPIRFLLYVYLSEHYKNRTGSMHKVSYGWIWDKAEKALFAVSRLKKP